MRRGLEHGGVGCRRTAVPPTRARRCGRAGAARRGAVADEVGLRLLFRLRSALRPRRSAGRRGRRRHPLPPTSNEISTEPTSTTSPAAACSVVDGARVRRGQLDDGLGRLDLGDRLVERDGVALGDEPLHELGLGKTLTEVGEREVLDHAHSSTPVRLFGRSSTRSTASRIRSRSGRWCFSSFAGG